MDILTIQSIWENKPIKLTKEENIQFYKREVKLHLKIAKNWIHGSYNIKYPNSNPRIEATHHIDWALWNTVKLKGLLN